MTILHSINLLVDSSHISDPSNKLSPKTILLCHVDIEINKQQAQLTLCKQGQGMVEVAFIMVKFQEDAYWPDNLSLFTISCEHY